MNEVDAGILAVALYPTGRSGLGPISGETAPSAPEIRTEMQRVTTSAQFDASERNRRFLCYVIEETLAQRADRIKAYSIATTVFGRDVDFDPQSDPVVRMEAQRLRRSLERFYLTEGRDDPLRILLPKGGYVPEFQRLLRPPAVRASEVPLRMARCGRKPSVLIRPFDVENEGAGSQCGETGLSYQLMIALSRRAELSVLGICPGAKAISGEERKDAEGPAADFVLMGSKAVSATTMHVKAVLIDASSGRVVWARRFERQILAENMLGTRDEIANTIARALLRVPDISDDIRLTSE